MIVKKYRRFRGGLYKSRSGIICGVCKGIARYFGFSVFWFRIIVLVGILLTGLWPIVGLYILAALLMKPGPPLHRLEIYTT